MTVRRLVQEHDLILLVEGSAYMDTWTDVLLWYFLWATHCAHAQHKPCLAYAVDAGAMSTFNQRLTRHIASQTDSMIARSQAAADRLRSWGVTAPMVATADNAFNFCPAPTDADFLGSQIARQLIQTTDCTLVALVRAANDTAATQRLSRAWWDWPETVGAIGRRIEVLCGDVTAP